MKVEYRFIFDTNGGLIVTPCEPLASPVIGPYSEPTEQQIMQTGVYIVSPAYPIRIEPMTPVIVPRSLGSLPTIVPQEKLA